MTARIDLRAGGDYRWNIIPGSYTVGIIREVEPGKRLVIGWGSELPAQGDSDPSTVEITLEPTTDGTRVRVVHTGLPEEAEAGHAAGWDHYLNRLAVAGSTGDAGPDSWLDRLDDSPASSTSRKPPKRASRSRSACSGRSGRTS